MLILVAVTINLAIDGGLFTKSRKATRDTEEQAIYDQIVSAMELKDDGKIKPRDTFKSFKNKFGEDKITEKDGNTTFKIVFTAKGARDTYTYTITEDEIVIGEIKEPNDYDILKTYFLGSDGNGRNLDEIFDDDDNFIDVPTNGELIKYYGPENTKQDYYIIKYKNVIYKLNYVDNDTDYKTTGFFKMYEAKEDNREGKDLGEITGNSEYNGWIILYDHGSYVEAVSPSAMGELQLGSDKDQPYGDSEESNAEYDKAITSYDTAIETINNYCKNLPSLPTNNGIRSVGAEIDTTTTYVNLDPLNHGWANNRGFKIENRGKQFDDYYEQDAFRMIYYNILSGGKDYWIASRDVYDEKDLELNVIIVNYDWDFGTELLRQTTFFELHYNMTVAFPFAFSHTYAVRPIIKVEI